MQSYNLTLRSAPQARVSKGGQPTSRLWSPPFETALRASSG